MTLNDDQETTPGGTVSLTTGLGYGINLTILSEIAYEQSLQLTNYDRFAPENINTALDKTVALIHLSETFFRLHRIYLRALPRDFKPHPLRLLPAAEALPAEGSGAIYLRGVQQH